jgi:hypothetical protein
LAAFGYVVVMSDNVTNELLLEHLKAIQAKLARHDEAFQRIEGEIRVLKSHIYGIVQAEMGRDPDMASLLVRIDRIERLELND